MKDDNRLQRKQRYGKIKGLSQRKTHGRNQLFWGNQKGAAVNKWNTERMRPGWMWRAEENAKRS